MTELLEIAIAKIKNLSDCEQNNIAAMILEEIEDDKKLQNIQQSNNLAELIQKRFADIGVIDNLPIVSRDAMREPPKFI